MNNMNYAVVDRLYRTLGIKNDDKIPKRILNTGTMDRKLNTNYSAVIGNKPNTSWSNSAEMTK